MKNFKTVMIENLFVVRWYVLPDAGAAALFEREAGVAARSMGHPAHYVALIGADVDTLTLSQQRLSIPLAISVLKLFDSMEVVLEGDSMRQSLNRTIIRGLLMTGRAGNRLFGLDSTEPSRRVFMHATFESAVERLKQNVRMEPAMIARTLRTAGLAS